MNDSQVMPTIAAPPPAVELNKTLDQCSSSPTNRRMLTASVISAGIMIRRVMESRSPALVSVMGTSPPEQLSGQRLAPLAARTGALGVILVDQQGSGKTRAVTGEKSTMPSWFSSLVTCHLPLFLGPWPSQPPAPCAEGGG